MASWCQKEVELVQELVKETVMKVAMMLKPVAETLMSGAEHLWQVCLLEDGGCPDDEKEDEEDPLLLPLWCWLVLALLGIWVLSCLSWQQARDLFTTHFSSTELQTHLHDEFFKLSHRPKELVRKVIKRIDNILQQITEQLSESAMKGINNFYKVGDVGSLMLKAVKPF
ncbi:hypothetical protein QOT17_012555 [Balamuthia mandrillaris]